MNSLMTDRITPLPSPSLARTLHQPLPDSWRLLPSVLTDSEADCLLERCWRETCWAADSYEAFGRRFELPRLQAWFADNGLRYRYSDSLLETRPWPRHLQILRERIEAVCGHQFNSVLLTCYRDGHDQVGWHADNEVELGDDPVIASLSLGVTRHLYLRHNGANSTGLVRNGGVLCVPLPHNSLLLMDKGSQQCWQHAVLPEPEVDGLRINLTFRRVVAGC